MRFRILISVLGILTAPALAQWEPDVRLTNDPANSFLANPNNHAIAAIGDSVHVVFTDNRTGGYQVYYLRSLDAGATWDSAVQLSNDSGGHIFNPTVAATGGTIHVGWPSSALNVIMYRRSTDAGATWSAEESLVVTTAGLGDACLAADGNTVGLVWGDERDGNYNGELYLKRSNDGGQNWGADTRLTFRDDTIDKEPCLAIAGDGDFWHLTWVQESWSTYTPHAWYTRSADGGAAWELPIPLTADTTYQDQPIAAVSGPNVHLCWYDGRAAAPGIYYRHSLDNGGTWGPEQRISDTMRIPDFPNLAASGANVYGAWQSRVGSDFELGYGHSGDNGLTWSAETLLASLAGMGTPVLTAAGYRADVLWYDSHDGNFEIYYKRNLTAGGIEEGARGEGRGASGMPTIVRGVLEIGPQLTANGLRLGLYDINGRRVMDIPHSAFRTPHSVDVSRLAPGVYFLRSADGNQRSAVSKVVITR